MGRTKVSLLAEANDIQKAMNDSIDRRRFSHMAIEQRLHELEHLVFATLASRVDDLRERAEAMPDDPVESPGSNLADATKKELLP